jgi:hypothetical protein
MYVYKCTCIYIYMYLNTHTGIYHRFHRIHVYMYTFIFIVSLAKIDIYVYIHIHTYIHTYIHMCNICIHTSRKHVHTFMHAYIETHILIHKSTSFAGIDSWADVGLLNKYGQKSGKSSLRYKGCRIVKLHSESTKESLSILFLDLRFIHYCHLIRAILLLSHPHHTIIPLSHFDYTNNVTCFYMIRPQPLQ